MLVCHAGPGLGIGHLARGLRVAKALQDRILQKPELWVIGKAASLEGLSDLRVREFYSEKDFIMALRERTPPSLLVLDFHPQRIPRNLRPVLEHLRMAATKIVGIDGPFPLAPWLDLIFIPSFTSEGAAPKATASTSVVFGWDCYLLDAKPEVRVWTPGNEVLALTGGSDATSLGKTWPSILERELPAGISMHWVVGPFAEEPVFPCQGKVRFVIHRALGSLQPLMGRIHYAVTVFGVGFFELLRQGVPTVVFSPYGEKDEPVLRGLRAEGLALVAQDETNAARQLAKLMADPVLAAQISAKAKDRLSQDGAIRLQKEIQRLFAADALQKSGKTYVT